MSPRRSNAFTLIELLVVISIIALLLSVMLPSLAKARETAKRTICASNLHKVFLGVLAYAGEHRGMIPPFHNGLHYRWPYQSTLAFVNVPGQPEAAGPWNLAFLHQGKYITNPRVFYCPAQKDPNYIFASYSRPWGTFTTSNIRVVIFSSYSYNPYFDPATGKNLYTSIVTFPRNKIMAMDVPFYSARAHLFKKQWGWNILNRTGSVKFGTDAQTCKSLQQKSGRIENDCNDFLFTIHKLEQDL